MELNEKCDQLHTDISLESVRFHERKEKKNEREDKEKEDGGKGKESGRGDCLGVLCDHDMEPPLISGREPGWWKEEIKRPAVLDEIMRGSGAQEKRKKRRKKRGPEVEEVKKRKVMDDTKDKEHDSDDIDDVSLDLPDETSSN